MFKEKRIIFKGDADKFRDKLGDEIHLDELPVKVVHSNPVNRFNRSMSGTPKPLTIDTEVNRLIETSTGKAHFTPQEVDGAKAEMGKILMDIFSGITKVSDSDTQLECISTAIMNYVHSHKNLNALERDVLTKLATDVDPRKLIFDLMLSGRMILVDNEGRTPRDYRNNQLESQLDLAISQTKSERQKTAELLAEVNTLREVMAKKERERAEADAEAKEMITGLLQSTRETSDMKGDFLPISEMTTEEIYEEIANHQIHAKKAELINLRKHNFVAEDAKEVRSMNVDEIQSEIDLYAKRKALMEDRSERLGTDYLPDINTMSMQEMQDELDQNAEDDRNMFDSLEEELAT